MQWSTSSERNNAYFILERSETGLNWQEIKRVEPKNDNELIKKYRYTDSFFSDEVTYYRLSQVDFDGKKETFKAVTTECKSEENDFRFYPNPSQNEITLVFTTKSEQVNSELSIVDKLGRKILTKQVDLKKGANVIPMNLNVLPGVYVISYTSPTFGTKTRKLIVQ